MARKFPAAKSLGRSSSQKNPKPIIVIVCEGKVTEPRYFLDFRALHSNGLVEVKPIGGCGVPVSVVERAIEEKVKLEAVARKSKDSFDKSFEVWAVFDRDQHPSGQVERATEMAASHSVFVGYSNPCFEVWGLMHYSCYAKPGHHHDTQRALKAVLDGYCHEKNPVLDVQALRERYSTAVTNAERALTDRANEGQTNGDPCTTVHKLTERIRLFGRS